MNSMKTQKGFVALMSVIIISAIMLTLIFTLNLSSYFARFDALGGENKRVSLGLAEACVEAAKLKIAQNAAYAQGANGDTVTVTGAQTCKICNVTRVPAGGTSYTIYTRAGTNGSYSNLAVGATIAPSTFAVTSWTENSSYFGPGCTLP